MRRVRARRCGDLEFRQPSCHPDATLSAAKGSGGPASPHRGHRDDSNRFEREWGESKEIRRIAPHAAMNEVATSPDERLFGTAARDAMRNVPGVGFKEKQNSAVRRSRPGRNAPVISSEELAQSRLIRPIRVQTCWSRPDDRATIEHVLESHHADRCISPCTSTRVFLFSSETQSE